MKTENTYCRDLVRRVDPDRFLLSLFAPSAVREDLWALFAFNHEIAKTKEIVTDARLGLIRLQWWRDQIAKIYETNAVDSHNEILQAFSASIHKHSLPREEIENLIRGREFDLENMTPSDWPAAIQYVKNINVPLMKLAAKIVNTSEDVESIALNFGLMRLIFAIPFHASQQRSYVPEDISKNKNETFQNTLVTQLMSVFYTVKPHNQFLRAVQILAELYKEALEKDKGGLTILNSKNPIKFKEIRILFRLWF